MTVLYVHKDDKRSHMSEKHGIEMESADDVKRAKRNDIKAEGRERRLAARREKLKTGAEDAIKAYWADKPYYTTRDEFLELCKVDVLTEERSEDIREQWEKRRGPDVASQTCMTRSPLTDHVLQLCLSA